MAREAAELQRIRDTHLAQLERARALAAMLAAEAADITEDGGIRDLVDEDAEVDAAVAAALVRQTSLRAMHSIRRVAELEAMGDALSFGSTTEKSGKRLNVGRHSVIDDDDVLLVDWRAPAAIPFYRATPLDDLGVAHRRHLVYGDDVSTPANEVVSYSDEVFDLETLGDGLALRGEAAILATVSAPTAEQMKSVVATIQAEQDAVVRAPSDGALVVQGGPGTGKTVVALHRAAYLFYDKRSQLAENGVLIVGPSTEFLSYISGVLPSLGETGVVSVTAPALFPGVLRGREESAAASELKGREVMADVLAKAVSDRQRRPSEPFQTWYGSRRVQIEVAQLQELFDGATRYPTHNDGANAFRRTFIEALSAQVYDPTFENLDDARSSFRSSPAVEHFLLRHWPPLTPTQALNDLFGSKALLRSAARSPKKAEPDLLTEAERELLGRKRTPERELDDVRWSDGDIPLLDELLALLGGRMGGQTEEERTRERDAIDEFELAAAADELTVSEDLDDDEDLVEDLPEGVTHADLAARGMAIDHQVFMEPEEYHGPNFNEDLSVLDAVAGQVSKGYEPYDEELELLESAELFADGAVDG